MSFHTALFCMQKRKGGILKKRNLIMEEYMMGFVIALMSGALMSVQGVFNTDVTKERAYGLQIAGCRLRHFWSALRHGFLPERKALGNYLRWKINMYC